MVANNNNNNSSNKKNNAAIKSSSSPHNNNNHHHNNNNNNKGNINKSPKSPSGRDSVLHSKSQQNFQYSNNRRSPKHQKTGNSNAAPQTKYPRKAIDKFNDQTFSEAPEEPLGNFIGGSFVEAGSSHQSANNRIELSRPHLSTSTPTSISIRDFKDGYFVTRPTSSSPPNSSSSSSSLSASSSAESSKEKVESVFVTPAKLKDNNLPLPLLSEAPTPSSVRNVQNFILSATSLPPSSSSFSTSSSSSSSSPSSSSSSANSSFDSLVSTSLPNLSIIESTSTPPSIIITGKQQLNHSPPRSTSPLSSSFLLTTPPPISSSSPSSPTIITHRKVRSRSDIKSSPSSAFAHYANPPPPTHIPIPSFS